METAYAVQVRILQNALKIVVQQCAEMALVKQAKMKQTALKTAAAAQAVETAIVLAVLTEKTATLAVKTVQKR